MTPGQRTARSGHTDVDTPVLVVGAGPVGATLALELAHHGITSVVVDRARHASRHPKMDFLNARSMELLRRLGLTDAIRDRGVPADHEFTFMWMRDFTAPPVSRWSYPSVTEARATMAATNDGTQPLEPYQRIIGSSLEQLGRERCAEHDLVDLRAGHVFESLHQEDDAVRAEVVDSATGTRYSITARYLVACDGANSAVRDAAGIGVDEFGPTRQHCITYFRSTDPALTRYGRFFLANTVAGLTLVSRDGTSTWTATFPIPEDEDFTGDPMPVIRQRLGVDIAVDEVMSVAQWRGRFGVARSYRAGRVFLAGDAAHQFFPTGGHGANTGLGDAVDLGWKLAAVVSGWGGERLLASYEAERQPVARFNREMSFNLLDVWRRFPTLAADGATDAMLAGFLAQDRYQINNIGIHFGYRYGRSPVVWPEDGAEPRWEWQQIVPTTWPGARLPSVRLANGRELHDLLGPELSLLDLSGAHAGKPIAEEAARIGLPLSYLVCDDEHVREVCERDLILVRPDQHVAWRGNNAPESCHELLGLIVG
ncbi:FAD-dependent monooxygenase [Actinophytocola sp.]|uniref:FAD-dependent monooxygenase n=1 Tax=Actinophytocola sp. TaxID=1872138 RepID=UPI003D6A0170